MHVISVARDVLLLSSSSHMGPDTERIDRSTASDLVFKDEVAKTSKIFVELHLIDAEFRKAWMPFFCRSGHPVITNDQFLAFVDPFLHQEAVIDLPQRSAAGGWDGWA